MSRRRWRKVAIALATVALALIAVRLLPGAEEPPTDSSPSESQITVIASFYPLAYFAERIGDSRAEVINLTPYGSSPHDWEPKISDIRLLNEADLFVYNGLGFEPWLTAILNSLDRTDLLAINTSNGLPLGSAGDVAADRVNPHIWLDPVLAQHQVRQILQGMIAVDPDGESTYQAGADRLLADLAALDAEYTSLRWCPDNTIVITHDYLAYTGERYGFTTIPLMGLAAETEPTPGQLGQIVSLMKDYGIKYVFDEPFLNTRVTVEIANLTGATVLALDPIESLPDPRQAGEADDYLSLMRKNLQNLRLALGCESSD